MILQNKVALVTGASRGIGYAVAEMFLQEGAAVVICATKEAALLAAREELLKAVPGGRVYARAADISKSAECENLVEAAVKEFGGLDILVNNAGITKDNLVLRMKEEDFDAVISVNLKGAFNFTRHLSRPLTKSTAGRVINISSVSGISGNVGQANYSAAKAGLIGLTKTTARELASRKVTCNAIAPGFIETEMTAVLPKQVIERVMDSVPLGRMGKVEEIADLAVFLASDNAAYITGEVIKIDGGMLT